MQTEWHHYKGALRNRDVGAYGYCPEHSDDNLVHVYISREGKFVAVYFVKALITQSGPIAGAKTFAGAKTAAMRPVIDHIKGQGSLKLSPGF